MPAPSENGSSSSWGSGSISSSTAIEKNKSDDDFDAADAKSFVGGINNICYTVSKEKPTSLVIAFLRLFVEPWQLLLLIVSATYGWNINARNRVWQAVSVISLDAFMVGRGYSFFLAFLYILVLLLAANLALMIWMYRNVTQTGLTSFPLAVACLKYCLTFFQVLDVTCMTLVLMPMDCNYFDVPADMRYRNTNFPEYECWSMPFMIHVIIGAAGVLLLLFLTSLFNMASIDLSPVSRCPMALAHTKVEVYGFCIKMFMTSLTVFVTNQKWMSILMLFSAVMLARLYLIWLPHMYAVVNHVRIGSFFSVAYASLLLIILSFHPGVDKSDAQGMADFSKTITTAMWAGLVPFGLVGAAMSWWHTRYYRVTVFNKFRASEAPASPRAAGTELSRQAWSWQAWSREGSVMSEPQPHSYQDVVQDSWLASGDWALANLSLATQGAPRHRHSDIALRPQI